MAGDSATLPCASIFRHRRSVIPHPGKSFLGWPYTWRSWRINTTEGIENRHGILVVRAIPGTQHHSMGFDKRLFFYRSPATAKNMCTQDWETEHWVFNQKMFTLAPRPSGTECLWGSPCVSSDPLWLRCCWAMGNPTRAITDQDWPRFWWETYRLLNPESVKLHVTISPTQNQCTW